MQKIPLVIGALMLAGSVVLADGHPARAPDKTLPPVTARENPDVEDATANYRARYGLPGRFVIDKAEIDSRIAAADGPAYYKIDAKFTKVGFYTFTFENRDDGGMRGYVFEVRKVSVLVEEHSKDAPKRVQPVVVSPENFAWATYFRGRTHAAIGDQIRINWSYNPGGEGIPGGWVLASVEDSRDTAGLTPGRTKR